MIVIKEAPSDIIMSQFRGKSLPNQSLSTKPEKPNLNKKKSSTSSIKQQNAGELQQSFVSPSTDNVKLNKTTSYQLTEGLDISNLRKSYSKKTELQAKAKVSEDQTTTKTVTKSIASKQATSTANAKDKNIRLLNNTASEPTKSVVKCGTSSKHFPLPTKLNKPNAVLDTYQNVTVASPPPKVKQFKLEAVLKSNDDPTIAKDTTNQNVKHLYIAHKTDTQTQSAVLQNDIDKNDHLKEREKKAIEKADYQNEQCKSIIIKEPISFEINFEEEKHANKAQIPIKLKSNCPIPDSDSSDTHYSDDFESYESDFEMASSTSTINSTEAESSMHFSKNENATPFNEETYNNELQVQYVNQNIATQKLHMISAVDEENELNSGNYKINMHTKSINHCSQHRQQQQQQSCDSLEGFSIMVSEQLELDSGISSYGNQIVKKSLNEEYTEVQNDYCVKVYYEGYREFFKQPFQNIWSSNLLTKIQFDALGYTLLDMKPLCYDIFMQIYGNLYSKQIATQTQDDKQENEVQTEFISHITKWTQYPSLRNICCDDVIDNNNTQIIENCKFDMTHKMLKNLIDCKSNVQNTNDNPELYATVKLNSLKSFLRRASVLVSQCVTLNQQNESTSSLTNIGNTSTIYCLKTNILNNLKVVQVFANPRFHLIITVHERLPETKYEHFDFVNVLMIWSCNDFDTPIHLLNTWSEVSYVEISNSSPDIVVSALRDGNIVLWDLNETYSHTNFFGLDSYLISLVPSQIIMPNCRNPKTGKPHYLMDLGACIDIKSFRYNNMNFFCCSEWYHQDCQFVSLHDSGILTVWTLIKNTNVDFNVLLKESKFKKRKPFDEIFNILEETSPWANYKLVQTAITNLRDYIKMYSRIAKNETLFQKNISNDKMFMESSEQTNELYSSNIHFNCLDAGLDNIYVCSNQHFIIVCTKTLKSERFKRLPIPKSFYLYPVFIKLLQNENYLVVGFPNAEVIILNIESYGTVKNSKSFLDIKPKRNITNTPNSAKQHASISPMNTETSTGKSCTIQNIILNERKSLNTTDYYDIIHPPRLNISSSSSSMPKFKRKPYDINIYDYQLILPGLTSCSTKPFLSIKMCYDEERLYTLTNGVLRVYDFRLQRELEMFNVGNNSTAIVSEILMNVTIVKDTLDSNCLIFLKQNNEVHVHKFKTHVS